MKANDRLNMAVVLGVLVIVLAALAVLVFVPSLDAEVQQQFSTLVVAAVTGLLGFLSRGRLHDEGGDK